MLQNMSNPTLNTKSFILRPKLMPFSIVGDADNGVTFTPEQYE